MTERHEIEAWLGDDHGLTEQQITDLVAVADRLAQRYPDRDQADDREAGLTVAYQVMIEDAEDVVRELGAQLWTAQLAAERARVGLRTAAGLLVEHTDDRGARGVTSEAGFARLAGVDRSTVRRWTT